MRDSQIKSNDSVYTLVCRSTLEFEKDLTAIKNDKKNIRKGYESKNGKTYL